MQLLGTPADIIDGSVTYIRITCGLIIVQVGLQRGCIGAQGDRRL